MPTYYSNSYLIPTDSCFPHSLSCTAPESHKWISYISTKLIYNVNTTTFGFSFVPRKVQFYRTLFSMHKTSNAFCYFEGRDRRVLDTSQFIFRVLPFSEPYWVTLRQVVTTSYRGFINTQISIRCFPLPSHGKLSIRGITVMYLVGILQDLYTVMHFKFTINNIQCAKMFVKRQKFLYILQ